MEARMSISSGHLTTSRLALTRSRTRIQRDTINDSVTLKRMTTEQMASTSTTRIIISCVETHRLPTNSSQNPVIKSRIRRKKSKLRKKFALATMTALSSMLKPSKWMEKLKLWRLLSSRPYSKAPSQADLSWTQWLDSTKAGRQIILGWTWRRVKTSKTF